jgi:hypothetical protein
MSISSLGPGQDLLGNVNRWRGQLSLPPIKQEDLQLTAVPDASVKLQVFDQIGVLEKAPMSRAATEDSPLTFDIPDGWQTERTSAIVKVRLTGGSEKEPAQITVTQLQAEFNQWLPNAQRWSEQVGMQADEAFLAKLTSDVTIDSITGKKIQLIPENDSQATAMIGAMVIKGELAWFFKMMGDRDVVINNKQTFEQFLDSFRFN